MLTYSMHCIYHLISAVRKQGHMTPHMYVLVNTSDVYICYVQLKAGEVSEVIRVFLQTPTGCCHVDITRAVLQSHLKVAL